MCVYICSVHYALMYPLLSSLAKKNVKPCPEIHLSKLLATKNPQGTC